MSVSFLKQQDVCGAPLRLFNLKGLGIDQEKLLRDLAPTYQILEEDWYDVKRHHIHFLTHRFPHHKDFLEAFLPDYFSGTKTQLDLDHILFELTSHEREIFDQIKPFRKRSVSGFMLEKVKDKWSISQSDVPAFKQNTGDVRSLERHFPPTSDKVITMPEFKKLVSIIGDLVETVRPKIKQIKVVLHQMCAIAKPKLHITNAPEGIHQDGVDYVISAIVIERKGITGGESQIFGPDKKKIYFSHVLQQGEGIFHADLGSPIWHYVTPIELILGELSGHRAIIGFDISIVQ